MHGSDVVLHRLLRAAARHVNRVWMHGSDVVFHWWCDVLQHSPNTMFPPAGRHMGRPTTQGGSSQGRPTPGVAHALGGPPPRKPTHGATHRPGARADKV